LRQTLAARLTLAACLGLYFVHFAIVMTHAVNVPFWDEWEMLAPQQLPAGLSLAWLYEQHNEHRVVTSKLLTWALYRFNGWNHVGHQAINFLLYGLLLFVLVRFAKRSAPWLDTWISVSFIIFLLSPIAYENHFWGFQSTFHFSLLFFFSSVHLFYREHQYWSHLLLGSLMALLAMYSASIGLVASLANLLLFSVFKLSRLKMAAGAGARNLEVRQWLAVLAVVGAGFALWLAGYNSLAHQSSYVLPHTRQFWLFFAGIAGLGFGLDTTSFLPNLFCLLIVFTPIVVHVWRTGGRFPNASWAVYAAVAGVVAALAAITLGRASFGIPPSKGSRYSEIAMMLIPLSALTWSISLQHTARLRNAALIALWAFCFVTFQNNWSSFFNYEGLGDERRRGLRCIQWYYENGGGANCPTLYPFPLEDKLDNARSLNASFYQHLVRGLHLHVTPRVASSLAPMGSDPR
jgi:hypothetical protein